MSIISNDISKLDFGVIFDLSVVNPTITLNNLSTGTGMAQCEWWYVIKTPSGGFIHAGTQGGPDIIGTWSTELVPDTWPQPMFQIEYSGSNYSVELFVKDGDNNIFSLKKEFGICRPRGLKVDVNGNFGVAEVTITTKCERAKLYVEDATNYVYKNNQGTLVSKTFVLDYPLDPDTKIRPTQFTLTGRFSTALIPIPFSAPGYNLFLDTIVQYDFDSDITVLVKYKGTKNFPVYCNIDLCPLVCAYAKLIDDVNSGVLGDPAMPELRKRLEVINGKMVIALTAKMQPTCGVDLPALIEEIKALGGFTCDCNIPGGINGGSVSSNINIAFDPGCGDITAQVISNDGTNIRLKLSDRSYVVDLTADAVAAGMTVTPTYDATTCTKTYLIDYTPVPVASACPVRSEIHEHTGNTLPTTCPNTYFTTFGVDVYDITDTTIIGRVYSYEDLIKLINSNAGYHNVAVAIADDFCHISWLCLTGNAPIVHIDILTPPGPGPGPGPVAPCLNNTKTDDMLLARYCDPTTFLNSIDYPFNAYIRYTSSGPTYVLNNVLSLVDFIAKLLAEPNLPSYITNYLPGNTPDRLRVVRTSGDCDFTGKPVPTLFSDRDYIIAVGANHHSQTAGVGSMAEVEMNGLTYMGKICGLGMEDNYPWHTIRIGNKGYTVETNTGRLVVLNLTDPRNPVIITQYILSYGASSVPLPFSGIPLYSGSFPSHDDVYFITDVNAQYEGQYLYIVESTSGYIWIWDAANDTNVGYMYSKKLIGKCPRIIKDGIIYFTCDGDREQTTGQNSGVSRRNILMLDTNIFGSSGFSEIANVAPVSDEVWTLSSDPVNVGFAYAITKAGAIVKINMPGKSVANTYLNQMGGAGGGLMNSVIWKGKMYVSYFGGIGGTRIIDLSALGVSGSVTAFKPLNLPGGGIASIHYTFTPIAGYCYGLIGFDNGSSPGGVAKFDYDGNFLGVAPIPAGDIYNVITFDGFASKTPNTLC